MHFQDEIKFFDFPFVKLKSAAYIIDVYLIYLNDSTSMLPLGTDLAPWLRNSVLKIKISQACNTTAQRYCIAKTTCHGIAKTAGF